MTETISIPVDGGMCIINFQMGCSIGRDADVNPGVGFDLVSEVPAMRRRDGKHHAGMGVFSRSDAVRLRDALDKFLTGTPPATR